MLTLAAAIINAKNLLSDPGAWLLLLEVQFNDPASTVERLVRNTENITWNSQTWTAFPFIPDPAKQNADGSIQKVQVRVSNYLRAVEGYILDADGAVGSTVILRVVYSEELALDAVIEETFVVTHTACAHDWCTFELGPENLWRLPFPRERFDRQVCRYEEFKGTSCGYSGAATSCARTLDACIALSNQGRYGAFPAIPGTGFTPDETEISTADS